MLDALLPAVDASRTALAGGRGLTEAWDAYATAAEAGAAATAPRLGRASDLDARAIRHQVGGAVAIWLRTLADSSPC